jgi:hypothetical protein
LLSGRSKETPLMWKAVLGLHYKRKEQKEKGQLAIF